MSDFIGLNVILLGIMVLRKVFGSRISMRLRYALWLMVPVYIFVSPFLHFKSPVSLSGLAEKPGIVGSVARAGEEVVQQLSGNSVIIFLNGSGDLEAQTGRLTENQLLRGDSLEANLSSGDMSGIGLSGEGMSGIGLSDEGAPGAGMASEGASGMNLSGESTSDTILSGDVASGMNLSGTDMSHTDLSGEGLQGTGLADGNVIGMGQSSMSDKSADSVAAWQIGRKTSFGRVWIRVRIAVSTILFCLLGIYNILFWMHCVKQRRFYIQDEQTAMQVFVLGRIHSPFLLWNKIYMSHEIAEDEKSFHYALLHEFCHFRQGDFFWPILKYVLLCVYWFDPLVWVAVWLVQRDSELSCDEGVVRLVGVESCEEYGSILLRIIWDSRKKEPYFNISTAMSGRKSLIRERIENLALATKDTRGRKLAGAAAILLLFTLTGCALLEPQTGARDMQSEALARNAAGDAGEDIDTASGIPGQSDGEQSGNQAEEEEVPWTTVYDVFAKLEGTWENGSEKGGQVLVERAENSAFANEADSHGEKRPKWYITSDQGDILTDGDVSGYYSGEEGDSIRFYQQSEDAYRSPFTSHSAWYIALDEYGRMVYSYNFGIREDWMRSSFFYRPGERRDGPEQDVEYAEDGRLPQWYLEHSAVYQGEKITDVQIFVREEESCPYAAVLSFAGGYYRVKLHTSADDGPQVDYVDIYGPYEGSPSDEMLEEIRMDGEGVLIRVKGLFPKMVIGDPVEWVTDSSGPEGIERVKELGMEPDDMLGGFYVYNEKDERIEYQIADDCICRLIGYDRYFQPPIAKQWDRAHEELLADSQLRTTMLFWIRMENGKVVSIQEQYVP